MPDIIVYFPNAELDVPFHAIDSETYPRLVRKPPRHIE
jgi:hypothetical protein